MKFHSDIEASLWQFIAYCRTHARDKSRWFAMLIDYYHSDLSDKYHIDHAVDALDFLNGLSDEKPGIKEIKENIRPKIEFWITKNNELEF